MAKDRHVMDNHPLTLPKTTSGAIRGKQSVRATFKLTENCIKAITIVAIHLGIKQKSLFDHLIEDTEALKQIAESSQQQPPTENPVVAKTFVISRNSMEVLKKMSEEYEISRESLIELSVQRLKPIIAKEQFVHEERKKFIKQINEHLRQGKKIQEKINKTFGSNDIIHQKYDQIIVNYEHILHEIQRYIDKSRNIETYELH